ncbi:MAG: glutamate synthase large subunit [Tetragenococcus halophilus]|uniref:glutamate synthase large subunit n=1 Tax=Tetragenococcus halophilus TaxID=51669 RepID=UPI0021BBAECD|nr:glutamate synthase large subunit [Tetragenococcus halophilus]MCT8310420.1 glutamate synthase large subunit [Tetragenococcus halophilus]MDN6111721.1 glutamate synthase large subunit [Tetragenococcus halophilus]MDN6128665.1 glutamate synthase large subunit [Tetragenococcus halophilus]MDN6141154.1 glutamate synthase large subunit [Tetragenococcus halophilus]MDN6142882.1 glutamate synthase large subunit [Tetragenococcus halophilus]
MMKNRNKQSLYDSTFEKAACGMGFIAQKDGKASRELVDYALTMLDRMNHRGGTGAEKDTGDGAGMLMAMPDSFFRNEAKKIDVHLPEPEEYAVGMFFLPQEKSSKELLEKAVLRDIRVEGFSILWQRNVPYAFYNCGPGAQKSMPSFVQIFIQKPVDLKTGRAFEDRLYQLRRILEKNYDPSEFSICSLSSQTICYKGMLHANQVRHFFTDLEDLRMQTSIALIHSRFSTNTFPSWDRAQPYRFLAHNGEINTLRGAENWMTSHQIELYNEENSDSAKLENCMEYLYRNGRDIPQALMMMVPEAWSKKANLSKELTAFNEYNASFMMPWDGPAALCFTDGKMAGAILDRNGLRPSRYSITKDGFVVVASESGVVDFPASEVIEKGVLGPANIFIVDTQSGEIFHNEKIKSYYANKYPYEKWLKEQLLTTEQLEKTSQIRPVLDKELSTMWKLYGYTDEIIRTVIMPMAQNGEDPTMSMGFDSPLAILSDKPQSLFTYFKQQFAQVTNPPIDALREQVVIGTELFLGRDTDIRKDDKRNCHKLKIESPLLDEKKFAKIAALDTKGQKTMIQSILYDYKEDDSNSLHVAMENLFRQAEEKIDQGATILILSDREFRKKKRPIPILLAVSGLYNYLVRQKKGSFVSLIADTAEACEIHHFSCLIGYGVSAIYPYGVYDTLAHLGKTEQIENYRKAAEKGIIKVMSRMGISTIAGYQGAQLFEAVGLLEEVVQKYFTGTVSRIGGLSLTQIEQEYQTRYESAFKDKAVDYLPSGGSFQYKAEGEHHLYNPQSIYRFQKAVRTGDYELFKTYVKQMDEEALETPTSLRAMWQFTPTTKSISIDEVEPAERIVKRFKVGAMSFGSLSEEAHKCIAEGMNRIGAKSNSGEGGEHIDRYKVEADGRNFNSKIKQVASGRFGVHAQYLMSAEEIQIKMAQGAKPGEGGQLPANKAFPWVAEIRGSTPGVQLISPPPHHDIYSIEDLSQLIYDLKEINPYAKINVKLVSSAGVGTIAAGVVKAGADIVVIAGYDGGTGASPRTAIRDTGLPWEMGLAEAHQTLTMNHLRQRMTLETDGKLMTGRDIAIAVLLGAEEYSFGTLPLVAIGCVMMRVCNLNTCPVGVATQNPHLRKFFAGKPEHIENTMMFLAENLREIMAELGFKTIDEMVGHTEVIKPRFVAKGKAKTLDFSRILGNSLRIKQKTHEPFSMDRQWPELDNYAAAAIDSKQQTVIEQSINNVQRAVGARMGGWIAQRFGNNGLAEGLLHYTYYGIAGQSFASFIPQGMELKLIGEANDYVAKGLSGGRLIIVPPKDAAYDLQNSPIVGNVACFGANAGQGFFRGLAGERFCVRNSGADVVVEGCGDHGCEYMTGGVAVVLGKTGRNFGAGMSGGIAYVYDPDHNFYDKCNHEMVELFALDESGDDSVLKELLEKHLMFTDSLKAAEILDQWEQEKQHFVKVYPVQYHKMMDATEEMRQLGLRENELANKAFESVVGKQLSFPSERE